MLVQLGRVPVPMFVKSALRAVHGGCINWRSVPEWSPDRRTFPVIDYSVRKIVHQPRTACPM